MCRQLTSPATEWTVTCLATEERKENKQRHNGGWGSCYHAVQCWVGVYVVYVINTHTTNIDSNLQTTSSILSIADKKEDTEIYK